MSDDRNEVDSSWNVGSDRLSGAAHAQVVSCDRSRCEKLAEAAGFSTCDGNKTLVTMELQSTEVK